MVRNRDSTGVFLGRNTNQARGLAQYAIDFMAGAGKPDKAVRERTVDFFVDATICGISAVGCRRNAPQVLRRAAQRRRVTNGGRGGTLYGLPRMFEPAWAIAAAVSADREWDANGTSFADFPERNATQGEFGHNDFYRVPIVAAQLRNRSGNYALRGMVLIDEIRVRLGSVLSLKGCFIDHVLHGAIAAAATYGAMMGATVAQIESAIGMVVLHAVPFRGIRAGHDLSDSKGASAAISTLFAIQAVEIAMDDFNGPSDVFRNPQAFPRLFYGPGQQFMRNRKDDVLDQRKADESSFDLYLGLTGGDFAIMGMHFKLGIYEHQSAGALAGLILLLQRYPEFLHNRGKDIRSIEVEIYDPAFGIICDPAKQDPRTPQSADHSLYYLMARVLRNAFQVWETNWKALMLLPSDFEQKAIDDAQTRRLMKLIEVRHGGSELDHLYPEGIPTKVTFNTNGGVALKSGLMMFPPGHALHGQRISTGHMPVADQTIDVQEVLAHKHRMFGQLALSNPGRVISRLRGLPTMTGSELRSIDNFRILQPPKKS